MSQYIVRRLLLIFPTLLVASILLALMARVLPGDALVAAARSGRAPGTPLADEAGRSIVRAKLGLDKPFLVQYIRWILGWPRHKSVVYQSADGGATWRAIGRQSVKPISNAVFLTPTRGWGLRENMISLTKDGGRQWLNQDVVGNNLNALFILDESNVWVVGDGGTLLRTTEGGKRKMTAGGVGVSTWLSLASGTTTNLRDVTFVDLDEGWVVGDRGTLLRTVDGGETWHVQNSNTDGRLSSVVFADAVSGWVVGDDGTILRTRDGGLTWQQYPGLPEKTLNELALVDAQTLWAVGDDGIAIQTTDGGATWVPRVIQEGLRESLTGVAFGSVSNGVIVGSKGTVFTTKDGGITWAEQEIFVTRQRGDAIETEGPITKSLKGVSVVVSGTGTVRIWATTVESNWEWGLLGGNLGERFNPVGRSVFGEIKRTLGPSAQLMIMSLIIALVAGVPIGILSATRQDTWGDYAARTVAIGGLAVPTFWVAVMVILLPSYYLNWAPPIIYVSFFDDPGGNLYFYMLPSMVAGIPILAEIMRITRNMMLEVLREDYIRTAYSKGLRERIVIYRHALKNAMIPVVTMVGIIASYQLGGQVVIEKIFTVPGLGRLMLDAIENSDYPMIQGGVLFLGTVVIVMNLVVDLAYTWLDPRIRYA